MSISAMNTANFGQSFSPYTNNQSLPLQHPGFPNPGQQAPNFAQNASQQQQQQYQQMPGGKSKSPHDSVVVHVLMCFASSRFRSRRTALFSIHVAVGRNVHDSVPFTSCLTLCCLCSRTRLASAIAHGSPAIPTTPLPVCCCISRKPVARERENSTATRHQCRIAAGNAQITGAGQGRRNQSIRGCPLEESRPAGCPCVR